MSRKYWTRSSILPDIFVLHNDLRDPDKAELNALGLTPYRALLHGYLNGPCFSGMHQNEVVLMYGVVPEGNNGRIWMLASDKLKHHARGLCVQSKIELDSLKQNYSMLFNIVDERNKMTMKWLKWLGFEFGQSHALGQDNQLFKEFYLCPYR